MQDHHEQIIEKIQAVRRNPQSSFEYWIMLGTIFEEESSEYPTIRNAVRDRVFA